MLGSLLIILATAIFVFVDVLLYVKAPWPERTKRFYYKLPGGGIIAYFLLTRR